MTSRYFKSFGHCNLSALNTQDYTVHESQRETRKEVISQLGDLVEFDSFVVDTGHPMGYEVHTVCTNGVIVIANMVTKRVVTYLIARPGQIKRYGIKDETLIAIAKRHQEWGLNKL